MVRQYTKFMTLMCILPEALTLGNIHIKVMNFVYCLTIQLIFAIYIQVRNSHLSHSKSLTVKYEVLIKINNYNSQSTDTVVIWLACWECKPQSMGSNLASAFWSSSTLGQCQPQIATDG